MLNDFATLNSQVESNSGLYADYWSQAYIDGLAKAEELRELLANVTLQYEFDGGLSRALKMVAQLMVIAEERGKNRDAFFVRYGGFDHHSQLMTNLEPKFEDLSTALSVFHQEMVFQGLADKYTLVMTSEFARVSTAI